MKPLNPNHAKTINKGIQKCGKLFLFLLWEVYVGVEFVWLKTEEKKNCILMLGVLRPELRVDFVPISGGFQLAFCCTMLLFLQHLNLLFSTFFRWAVYTSVTFVTVLHFYLELAMKGHVQQKD